MSMKIFYDFGLYGCGWLELDQVSERSRDDDDPMTPMFPLSQSICQSTMPLEVLHPIQRSQTQPNPQMTTSSQRGSITLYLPLSSLYLISLQP